MNEQTILDFLHRMGVLKSLPRTGWPMRGIRNGESVADHSYRLTHLAMLLADLLIERGEPLDPEKVLRMAQLHEIGEAVIGDIPGTADSSISADEKFRIEDAAVEMLTRPLGKTGQRYHTLWREFEECTTPEARLVKAADKLEMMIQAWEYETEGYRTLEEFWQFAARREGFQGIAAVEEIVTLLEASRPGGDKNDQSQ